MVPKPEETSLLSGNVPNRRRHAWMVSLSGFIGALLITMFIVTSHSNGKGQSTILVQKLNGLTSAEQSEKNMVECATGFGVIGAALCPGSDTLKAAHAILSEEANNAAEVVHSLAPIVQPVLSAPSATKDAAMVNNVPSEGKKSAAPVKEVAPQPVVVKFAVADAASQPAAQPAAAPIDCACCHSKCQLSGAFKDPKVKASRQYWCVKKGKVGSPTYCPAQDYNCLCCDRVREQLGGTSCA